MQGNSNKLHNQVGIGIKYLKTIPSETKQTKASQTMDVTLIMKTKGSRRVQTTTNRMETWTDEVVLTAMEEHKWFSPSADEHAEQQQQQQQTAE